MKKQELIKKIEELKKQIKEIEKQKKELEIKILNDNGYKVGSTFEDYGTKYIIISDFLHFRPMRKDGKPSNSKESTKQLAESVTVKTNKRNKRT